MKLVGFTAPRGATGDLELHALASPAPGGTPFLHAAPDAGPRGPDQRASNGPVPASGSNPPGANATRVAADTMTLKGEDSIVVHRVSINEHPLIEPLDSEMSNNDMIESVEERTETSDDLDFPGWEVFLSDPPDDETIRYVNTTDRINVKARYDQFEAEWENHNFFDAVAERIEIEDFDVEDAAMSAFPEEHVDDFEGDIHLDLTDE